MYLPLNSIELMAMLPGHQQSATPRSLRRQHVYRRVCRQGHSVITTTIKILQQNAPVSTTHINMEPQVVLLTDVSDLIDGVECTVHCGTSCGVHKQWHVTLQNQHT